MGAFDLKDRPSYWCDSCEESKLWILVERLSKSNCLLQSSPMLWPSSSLMGPHSKYKQNRAKECRPQPSTAKLWLCVAAPWDSYRQQYLQYLDTPLWHTWRPKCCTKEQYVAWRACGCRNADGFKVNTQTHLAPVLASIIKVSSSSWNPHQFSYWPLLKK